MKYHQIVFILLLLFQSTLGFGQYLSKEQALEDFIEFKNLTKIQSSYYQSAKEDLDKLLSEIEKKLIKADSISMHDLAYELERFISHSIDRHTGVKTPDTSIDKHKAKYLPFITTSLNGRPVALIQNKTSSGYQYLSKNHPYIKEINGINIDSFLETYTYKSKLAPKEAKLNDALHYELRDISLVYFKHGIRDLNTIEISLSNGKSEKKLKFDLSQKRIQYYDIGSIGRSPDYRDIRNNKNFDLNKLDRWLNDSIGYISLPAMLGYTQNPNLESYIKNTIEKYRNSKALIIDLRGNGGGTRNLLYTFSGYLIQKHQSPWVANVAYVRSDQELDEDISSMESRYLYTYNSRAFTREDRKAIDRFNKGFKPEFEVDSSKFSQAYYMVLHNNDEPLEMPIYILVNEATFSAASVFTSAFKGLDNVKIVGVTTNGSSGRSKYFYLKHSDIRIRLSTMLSFQRNGKTLDGNGTQPDILISPDEDQVLGKKDTQLEKLIQMISN